MSLFRILTYIPFVPTDITDCSIWVNLDNVSEIDGQTVSTWTDQSGNGYDLIQPVTAYKPVVTGNGTYKSMRFSGTQFFYNRTALSILKNVTGASIFAVIKPSNGSVCLISDGLNSSNARAEIAQTLSPYKFKLNSKRLDAEAETSLTSTETIFSDYYIENGIYNFSSGNIKQYINSRLDGAANLTTSGNSSNTDSSSITVGLDGELPTTVLTPSSALYPKIETYGSFDLLELVVFNKALNDLERFQMERYLNIKYNISLSQLVPSSSLLPELNQYLPW
jgi:hypothetical protein